MMKYDEWVLTTISDDFSLVFLSTICLSVIAERSTIIIQIKLKL